MKRVRFSKERQSYLCSAERKTTYCASVLDIELVFARFQLMKKCFTFPKKIGAFIAYVEKEVEKRFMYYRLSLYIDSLAFFLAVMLQGNYAPDYLKQVRGEIEERMAEYRNIYAKCYGRIEKLAQDSIESNLLKGFGTVVKATGSVVRNIPIVKDSAVKEWLNDSGENLERNGEKMGKDILAEFSVLRDSGCAIFLENLNQVDRLYNQTQQVLINQDVVYLVKETA